MSRSRKKILKYGDRFNIYVSELVDDEILDFINLQSDLTATVMAGIIKLYQENGKVDLVNYLPRTYSINSSIPSLLVNNNKVQHYQPLVQLPIKQQDTPQSAEPIKQQDTPQTTEPSNLQGLVVDEGEKPGETSSGPETTNDIKNSPSAKPAFFNNSGVGDMAAFAMSLNKKKE
ncbi:MAG: hypothetical protein KBT36_08800 [Kurthia sp.]|nr:hypothetical protein [Candidatus Kurthia equi]